MCLAVPGRITEIDGTNAVVDILGVSQRASLRLTPEAQVGDYVLVHAGFSIQIVDEAEAQETLDLIDDMEELLGQGTGA